VNCPFHLQIYKSHTRSYRELPLRYAERGTVYRYEPSGTLHGLLRVRGFTQDDAHHFCRPDQMPEEIDFVLDFCLNMLRALTFRRTAWAMTATTAKGTNIVPARSIHLNPNSRAELVEKIGGLVGKDLRSQKLIGAP
jgi:threonyl-tRNA synthetase